MGVCRQRRFHWRKYKQQCSIAMIPSCCLCSATHSCRHKGAFPEQSSTDSLPDVIPPHLAQLSRNFDEVFDMAMRQFCVSNQIDRVQWLQPTKI